MAGYGIAIDVDGVLRRGNTAIEGAAEAIKLLDMSKVPYVLVSNSEKLVEDFMQEVNALIGLDIPVDRCINCSVLSINVLKSMHPYEPILVVGSPALSLPILRAAGMKNAVFPMQAIQRWPTGLCQGSFDANVTLKEFQRIQQVTNDDFIVRYDSEEFPDKVSTIFLLTDTCSWYMDTSVVCDVLFRHGIINPYFKDQSVENSEAGVGDNDDLSYDNPVRIYVANPDITYADDHPVPRFTLGASMVCISTMYDELTTNAYRYKGDLSIDFLGKPYHRVYEEAKIMLGTDRVYMIGDSITSDIAGANAQKDNGWRSVLVFSGKTSRADVEHVVDEARAPDLLFEDVHEAVKAIVSSNGIL